MIKVGRRLGVRPAHLSQLSPMLRTAAASAVAGVAAYLVKAALGNVRLLLALMVCAATLKNCKRISVSLGNTSRMLKAATPTPRKR